MACLLVKEKGLPTLNMPLADGRITMGRSKYNSVVLHNKYVSGKHCEIVFEGGVYTLIDLKSTNGLFVNGHRIASKELEDGDKILAGTSLIIFIADEHAFRSEDYIAQLRGGTVEERELAAGLLGEFGSADAVGPLIEAVKDDPHPRVQAAAAEALGSLGNSRAAEVLLGLFDTPDAAVRKSVVRSLVRLADERTVSGITAHLGHIDQRVRVLAAHALGQLRDSSATEKLIEALDDKAFVVREAAVKALGDIADPRAADALVRAAGEPGRFPQVWVIEALGKLRRPESMKVFLKAMHSNDGEIREAAADALGKIQVMESIPSLLRALDDPDEKVRSACAKALEKLRVHLEMAKTFRDSGGGARKTIEIAAIGEHEGELSFGEPKFGEDRSKWEQWWSNYSRR